MTNFIYKLSAANPNFSKDRGLCDQIQRAAVSIMSNISEGFEYGTTNEFMRFLYIAKGSAGEVRNQLYIAKDLNYIGESGLNKGIAMLKSTSATIYGLIESLKSSKYKGLRYATKEIVEAQRKREEFIKEMQKKYPGFK